MFGQAWPADLSGCSAGGSRSWSLGLWSGCGGEGIVQRAAEQFVQPGFPGPVLWQVQH
jgi:hypothetical protein